MVITQPVLLSTRTLSVSRRRRRRHLERDEEDGKDVKEERVEDNNR